jgi:hypothetical protein
VSAAADTKDWNGLLRQFALSGSGAGLAPEKKANKKLKIRINLRLRFSESVSSAYFFTIPSKSQALRPFK